MAAIGPFRADDAALIRPIQPRALLSYLVKETRWLTIRNKQENLTTPELTSTKTTTLDIGPKNSALARMKSSRQ